jgi:transposase-like protein
MTLIDVSKQTHRSKRSIIRWFQPLWQVPPKPKISTNVRVLVLDATSVKWRECMLLVAADADTNKTVSWKSTMRECYDSWFIFLYELRMVGVNPAVVVCDGQRGLIKAIHEIFPQAYTSNVVSFTLLDSQTFG